MDIKARQKRKAHPHADHLAQRIKAGPLIVGKQLGTELIAERSQRQLDIIGPKPKILGRIGVAVFVQFAGAAHRIGVLLGSWYGDEFAALYKADPKLRKHMLQTPEYEVLFTWLVKDRVDVVFHDLFNGIHILKGMNALDEVGVHPVTLNDDYIHFILSKLTVPKSTVDAIDNAIEAFQGTEGYTAILHKYVPPEQLTFMPMQ